MTPHGWPVRALAFAFALSTLLGADTNPPTGAALLKTDLLGVFAHPDDETGMAATVAATALGRGKTVAHVYCTRGEGGGNMVGTQFGPALGLLREIELRDALRLIGVRQVHFLDQADFAYTESLSVTLEKWGHEETLRRLVRVVRSTRPEVMVTMNPAPSPGQHGNHQAAGWLATEAFGAAADPKRFPEQIEVEGLSPWQPRKLFYGGTGGNPSMAVGVDLTAPLPDGRLPAVVAGEALSNHRSQGFGGMASSPWFRRTTNQWFTPVLSVVPITPGGTDLFAGLPVAGDTPPAWTSAALADAAPKAPPVSFRPRAAVAAYRRFVAEHGIARAAQSFTPDVPVVAGELNRLPLDLQSGVETGSWTFSVPDGWTARAAGKRAVDVSVPATASADVDLTAKVSVGAAQIPAGVRLHPVPHLRIPRAKRLQWNASDTDPAWRALPAVEIAPGKSWQGKSDGPDDLSGSFRVAHDGKTLFVEVRVRDDHVVSNIAPDDIKGHWRSDSVEICIDPAAGAEHTLGCWKAGIFPFDSAGNVRGARDADANPGPLEKHSPGTRLLSWRTADGYAVRAAIPFAEAGLGLSRKRRAGFNVLLYDGDKTNAAPGENINRTRLAWSPRPGVQGRPEDWGRVDFE